MPSFTDTNNRSGAYHANLLMALSLGASCAMASGNPEPTARALRTAECVAALEIKSEELAHQVKAGQAEQKPLLQTTLDAAAAFIGQAYLQGDRDQERLETLKNAALQEQKSFTSSELAARQTRCAQEGARLLSQADVISRFVISRLAARQMKRLLGD